MLKAWRVAVDKDKSLDLERGLVVMVTDCMPQIDRVDGAGGEVEHRSLEWLSVEAINYQELARKYLPRYEHANKVRVAEPMAYSVMFGSPPKSKVCFLPEWVIDHAVVGELEVRAAAKCLLKVKSVEDLVGSEEDDEESNYK
jgi:hypothetical protein